MAKRHKFENDSKHTDNGPQTINKVEGRNPIINKLQKTEKQVRYSISLITIFFAYNKATLMLEL